MLTAVAITAPASADTAPPTTVPATPATVSADGLPTWQINGVVWAQVVVGNTVYATGSFTRARPPGSPVGTNEVVRQNLLAYDITTGNLITSFNHTLSAQGLAIAVSPDGRTLYVGGDFTSVDGQSRGHVAAFDVATGVLLSNFHPSVGGQVRALVVNASTVFVGGDFQAVGATQRRFAAAFVPTTGALTDWDPSADLAVWAMTLSPDGSRMILGGRFSHIGGQNRYGLGAVDLTTGALTTWNSALIVRDAGTDSSITSLTADSTTIYGSGYVFGAGGNVEGTFAIDQLGNLKWLNDCHGDTYSTAVIGPVLYSVSHAHYCGNLGGDGGYPETNPRTFHRALAEVAGGTPGCVLKRDTQGYPNFQGQPCTTLLDWFPTVDLGTYTGQYQGAWSVVGNSQYIALGGEFPRVNGVAQQGLVRFAVSSIAPNKRGPQSSTALTPTATKVGSSVRLNFGATWDMDNAVLTYSVYRSGTGTPIGSTTADTRFWRLGSGLSVTDVAPPSGTFTYTVVARDAFGNPFTSGPSNSVTVTGGNPAPTANFTSSCTALTCSFNGSSSSDPNGTVVGYAWNFGDGQTATGATTSHTYAANGTFAVTLTVTDNQGAPGQVTKNVTVSGANTPPTANFTSSCTQLACSFNGGSSTDPDGTIVSYAWNFGDGQTGTGATVAHTYGSAGTYAVTLTVTDNHGAPGQVTKNVTATAPNQGGQIALDTFGRTVTSGWGSANVGGAWTALNSAANLSVVPGAGTLQLSSAGQTTSAALNATSTTSAVVTTAFKIDKLANGNGSYVSLAGRRLSATAEYRATAHVLPTGAVQIYITKLDGSANEIIIAAPITIPGLTYTAGSELTLKFSVVTSGGATALGAKLWAGGAEPANWQLTGADSTAALQVAGSVGVRAYLSGSSTSAPVRVTVTSFSATS
jgi:PKD repeat protein